MRYNSFSAHSWRRCYWPKKKEDGDGEDVGGDEKDDEEEWQREIFLGNLQFRFWDNGPKADSVSHSVPLSLCLFQSPLLHFCIRTMFKASHVSVSRPNGFSTIRRFHPFYEQQERIHGNINQKEQRDRKNERKKNV
jgi:hypothetical protein